MSNLARLKNRAFARVITLFPWLAKRLVDSYTPLESEDVPWTPVTKPLSDSTLAVVTTAGVHHRDQTPFDMADPDGDPTYRVIELSRPLSDLMITHDYYDHSDAERDVNVVFPVSRLREMAVEGKIRRVAEKHYSFMGHITGLHIRTLMEVSAPAVAITLRKEAVDAVLLTPG